MKTEYTVKEFADLCHTTVRTIKYYEEIGLLKAYRVNDNGYRIYHLNQMDRISTISLYQNQGYSLQQIKELLSYHSVSQLYDAMCQQERMIQQQIQQLHQKQTLLEYMIHETNQAICHPGCFYTEMNAVKDITVIQGNIHEITISYLMDGIGSGIVVDAQSGKMVGTFHHHQQANQNKRAVVLYFHQHPSHYHQPLHEMMDFCISEQLEIHDVYLECLIENTDTGYYLNKIYMFTESQ